MADSQLSSPTIDPNELSIYKEFSKFWWDKDRFLVGLKNMNDLRVPYIRDSLAKIGTIKPGLASDPQPMLGLLILDVGCGGGFLSEVLAELGGTVVGIDASPEQIEAAKEHAALNPSLTNLSYYHEAVDTHAQSNFEKYDVVVASEVLDHIKEPDFFLKECVRCLKPGGSIFVSTNSRTFLSWLLTIVVAEYVLNHIPRGTHEWKKFVCPNETIAILEKYKCKKVSVHGIMFNIFKGTWFWSWFQSLSYILHAVKNAN